MDSGLYSLYSARYDSKYWGKVEEYEINKIQFIYSEGSKDKGRENITKTSAVNTVYALLIRANTHILHTLCEEQF